MYLFVLLFSLSLDPHAYVDVVVQSLFHHILLRLAMAPGFRIRWSQRMPHMLVAACFDAAYGNKHFSFS
jgi:hypothetical protein